MKRRVSLAFCLLLVGCLKRDNSSRELVLVGINDIYRIEGVAGGAAGGLARVRTLRARLEKEGVPVLVFHAGDALSPAAISQHFGGEQMVDILNLLDGSPGFDDDMWMTFGNHEFDIKDAAVLDKRVEESQFHWLRGNVRFASDGKGAPLIDAPNLTRTALVERGGIRLGILSLVIDDQTQPYIQGFEDVRSTAAAMVRDLKSRGAEVVIGLTHLNASDDEALLRELGPEGLDLILGGHDHSSMAVQVDGHWLLKADADGKTVTVVHMKLGPGGLEVRHSLESLADGNIEPDPKVSERVAYWLHEYDPTGALAQPVGFTRVELDAEETVIRRYETPLGNWVTDQMKAAMEAAGARAAIVNSGSLRLNDIIAAKKAITRGNIEELLPYPSNLVLLRLDGDTLDAVLQHSVSQWNASGHFLQVSGIRFLHDKDEERAEQIEIQKDGSWRPLRSEDRIAVVTTSFLAGGGDGYSMLKNAETLAEGGDLKALLLQKLADTGKEGIAPKIEGRIRLENGKSSP